MLNRIIVSSRVSKIREIINNNTKYLPLCLSAGLLLKFTRPNIQLWNIGSDFPFLYFYFYKSLPHKPGVTNPHLFLFKNPLPSLPNAKALPGLQLPPSPFLICSLLDSIMLHFTILFFSLLWLHSGIAHYQEELPLQWIVLVTSGSVPANSSPTDGLNQAQDCS